MKTWSVPSVWAGTVAIAFALIFREGGIGSMICSVLCALFAGTVTLVLTDPKRGSR